MDRKVIKKQVSSQDNGSHPDPAVDAGDRQQSADSVNASNGAHPRADFPLAETAAPQQDLPSDELDEALGSPSPTIVGGDRDENDEGDAPYDLDAALGDETALRHELLDTAPTPITVRPPRKREFIAVHPTYARVATIVEYSSNGMSREFYLATPHIKARLEDEDKKTVVLRLFQSLKDRTWSIWPINLDQDGRDNTWNRSSLAIADEAAQYWGKRVNIKTQYVYRRAPPGHEPPTWPDKSWKEILEEAFKDRILSSPNHPVVMDLEGRK